MHPGPLRLKNRLVIVKLLHTESTVSKKMMLLPVSVSSFLQGLERVEGTPTSRQAPN